MWNNLTENENYPSETCECMIETTGGIILEARFLAPTQEFVSHYMPTYKYDVKRWKRI